jgi:thymidylate synthase
VAASTRIVLVKSDGATTPETAPGPFSLVFDNSYADRLAARLKNSIVQLIGQPSVLPQYLDDPAGYLPDKLLPHDIVIAVNIHEEILLELPALSATAGGKAIIVPREDPTWTTLWLRGELAKKCAALGLEVAFPKPFCSLSDRPEHPVINKALADLKIGQPEIRLKVKNGLIERVEVLRSAPCGDTYYVAEKLKGKPLDELSTWAFKFWASYPCLGAMVFDDDYQDLLQHAAGHILLAATEDAVGRVKSDSKQS